MADQENTPQNPASVIPVASIIILRDLLVEIKVASGQIDFDKLVDRITKSLDGELGIQNPSSAQLVKLIIKEARETDA